MPYREHAAQVIILGLTEACPRYISPGQLDDLVLAPVGVVAIEDIFAEPVDMPDSVVASLGI